MSASLARPSWSRTLSCIPGSFNTEDELSPIKSSFDMDDTHQALDTVPTSPGAFLHDDHNDDSSLQLSEHDDPGGGYIQNQTTVNTDDSDINVADNASDLSMIVPSTTSKLDSSNKHFTLDVSSHVHENDSPASPKRGRDDDDTTKRSTTPSEGLAPHENLASSSPTLPSILSTQPHTTQVADCSPVIPTHSYHSNSSQAITRVEHKSTPLLRRESQDHAIIPISEGQDLVEMLPRLSRQGFEAYLTDLVERYINQPVASEPAAPAAAIETIQVDSVSDSDRPVSPLGLRAHSASHDRLLKDNFDLRFKISCLDKMIDEMDGYDWLTLTEENKTLKIDVLKATRLSESQMSTIKELELNLAASEKKISRTNLEHRLHATKVRDLETEIKNSHAEATEFRRKFHDLAVRAKNENGALTKRISEKDDEIKRTTATNEVLLQELKLHTSTLASRDNERDFLVAQLEELKQSIESRRSSSEESRASRGNRERYEGRIETLKDQLSATKLAELDVTKKYYAKRSECTELRTMVERLDGLLDKKGEDINSLNEKVVALENERDHLKATLKSEEARAATVTARLVDSEEALMARSKLVETTVLQKQTLNEQLEKERQLRRKEKTKHDHASHITTQKDARITQLEAARTSDRRKLNAIELKSKDQIIERNQLLLSIWHRLSTVCGTDWQHQNNLINGHLASYDVINNMLPAFTKNLMLAIKCIEKNIGGFGPRVLQMEQDFARELESLERNLDMKSRRLERLEGEAATLDARVDLERATSNPHSSHARAVSEPNEQRWIHRLREYERRLKAEREERLLERSSNRARMQEQDRALEEMRAAAKRTNMVL